MKPYYSDDFLTLYHGDCREVMADLGPTRFDAIITDPVWPNAVPELQGSDDPAGLFASAAVRFPSLADRLVVHLGCDSDPRILQGVPSALPFFRACWLEYARPHYKGRLLYTSDVAYVFGTPPKSRPGAHVMPGKVVNTEAGFSRHGHPCPRRESHMRWLVGWFGGASLLDPFAGVGTTLHAAKRHGVRATGIEIEERFCESAAKRFTQGTIDFEVVA